MRTIQLIQCRGPQLVRSLTRLGFAGVVFALATTFSATAAVVERWQASSITNQNPATADGDSVAAWYGDTNFTSMLIPPSVDFGTNQPTIRLNATASGHPAVHFWTNSFLAVPAGLTPVQGLTKMSVAIVFRVNQNPTRSGGAWYQLTGLMDAEQGGVVNDWGSAINENGELAFGVGNPDTTMVQQGSLVGNLFHAAVMVWDPENQQMRITVDDRVTSVFTNTVPPANPRNQGDIYVAATSPTGPNDFDRFLKCDIAEIVFYDEALNGAQTTNLIKEFTSRYGLVFAKAEVTAFAAAPSTVPQGGSTLLSWQVTPNAERVLITPSPTGSPTNVTALTTAGIGSVTLSPNDDTQYTISVDYLGATAFSNVFVDVQKTVATSLLDTWKAETLTGLNDGDAVTNWTSIGGRLALTEEFAQVAPTFVANAGNGLPAVRFGDSLLRVPGTNSVVGGLNNFTLAYVLKVNANNPPAIPAGAWFTEVAVVDAEEGGDTRDWGATIAADGVFSFGVGGNDRTIHSPANLWSDGEYHVFTGTWGARVLRLYVDGVLQAEFSGTGLAPRNAADFTFGGPRIGFSTEKSLFGDLAEVRFYGDNLPAEQVAILAGELATKYGITLPVQPFDLAVKPTGSGKITLIWESVAGKQYTIWEKTSLDATWQSLHTVTATNNSTEYPISAGGNQGYYRVSAP